MALVLFFVPVVGAVGVAAAWLDRPVLHTLTDDLAPLEWVKIAGFGAAALLAAAIATLLGRARRTRDVALYTIFALGCSLVAADAMMQGRLSTGGAMADPLLALAGAYGALAPWVVRRLRGGTATELQRLVVPPLFLSSAFLVVLAYEVARLALPHHATVWRFGTWPEVCLALSLPGFALLTHQRLRRASTPVLPLLYRAAGSGH